MNSNLSVRKEISLVPSLLKNDNDLMIYEMMASQENMQL